MEFLSHLPAAGALVAFFQVVMIDLALAGDNAVAVGMAAAGLPQKQRRQAIVLGLAAAVVMLISFALLAVFLLKQIGLLLAGGLLLVWVCWKMWRDLRHQSREDVAEGEAALEDATGVDIGAQSSRIPRAKTMRQALIQILVADLAMSLDNVLAANRSVTPRLGRGRWDEPAIVSSRDRQELDGLLDKINVHGMASLSDAERDRLRELGKRFGD